MLDILLDGRARSDPGPAPTATRAAGMTTRASCTGPEGTKHDWVGKTTAAASCNAMPSVLLVDPGGGTNLPNAF